jgi:hypothetical protein
MISFNETEFHIAAVAGTAVAIRTVMEILAYRVRSPKLPVKG